MVLEVQGPTVSRRPVRRRAPRAPEAVALPVVLPEAAASAAAAAVEVAAVAAGLPASPPALPGPLPSVSVLPVGLSAVDRPEVGPAAAPPRPGPAGPRGPHVGVAGGAIGAEAILPSSRACGSQRVL